MSAPTMKLHRGQGRQSPAAMAAAGRGQPRDIMWRTIREMTAFGIDDLARPARLDPSSVRPFLKSLEAAGIIRRLTAGVSRYALVRDPGAATPHLDPDGQPLPVTGRQAAWSAMRVLKTFTVADLHVCSGIAISDAKSYLHYLVKAGYLRYAERGAGLGPFAGAKASRYATVPSRYPGPLAPQVTRIRVVFDPNSRTVAWPLHDDPMIEVDA